MSIKISRYIFSLIGIVIFIMGCWFILLRPQVVLLKEDHVFTGLSSMQLNKMHPRLFKWIGLVFTSWGAFIMGNGIFIFFLGYFGISNRHKWAWFGLAIGGFITLSIFLSVNILLNGHYIWLIGSLFFLLLLGLSLSYPYIFKSDSTLKSVLA